MKIANPNPLSPPSQKKEKSFKNGYEIINCDNIAALNLVKKKLLQDR